MKKQYSIWASTEQDQRLREVGYNVPEFPETGDVTDPTGTKVGYVDNFSGINTSNEQLAGHARALDCAVWNVL